MAGPHFDTEPAGQREFANRCTNRRTNSHADAGRAPHSECGPSQDPRAHRRARACQLRDPDALLDE